MEFRKANIKDIDRLSEIRKRQLMDEGQNPETDMDENLRSFFMEKMKSGELIEWVAEEDGEIVATAAIIFMDLPPAFTNPTGKKGYIANMYTADEFRGRGLAGRMIELLEKEAKDCGLTKLFLHASEMGKKAYVKSGFIETDVLMEKSL
ncbi:MAG: GNAT family N-acetyltransferase [Firmicutes bacterium]|nr:GNAT family N-acetyltransferase [Bacillota bacterium]